LYFSKNKPDEPDALTGLLATARSHWVSGEQNCTLVQKVCLAQETGKVNNIYKY